MSGPDNVRVMQADRDAGAEFWAFLGQHGSAEECRRGTGFRATAEAFARHREAAEAEAKAREAALVEALKVAHAAMVEYYRYWTGGETRGSYDGKPERNALWNAMHKTRAALAKEPDA